MRGISYDFIKDLKEGTLKGFLEIAINDEDISLQIRGNTINLYYKGGSAIRIDKNIKGYSYYFNEKYCLDQENNINYSKISEIDNKDPNEWIKSFPLIKEEMDKWFLKNKRNERSLQHKLISNKGDIKILDIEFAVSNNGIKKIDMIGINEERKKILLIENKYGSNSILGKSSIAKHYYDYNDIIKDNTKRNELLGSLENIIENKYKLGLLEKNYDISGYDIEILFVLYEYNPRSSSLSNEKAKTKLETKAKIRYISGDNIELNYGEFEDF